MIDVVSAELILMKAINIEWDVDCLEDLENPPTEIDIPENITDDEDAISDYISDTTGYCHKGFDLETEQEKCEHMVHEYRWFQITNDF